MKRNMLLFLLILLMTTSCSYSYTSKIALRDEGSPAAQQKAKYDLKAAIVVTPEQMEQAMTYNCALISIHIGFRPYPEMYQLMQKKIKNVFSTVDIVPANKLLKENYDVLLNSKFSAEKGYEMVMSLAMYGINAKNGDMLFGITSNQKGDPEFNKIIPLPGTIPTVIGPSCGKGYDKLLTEMVSTALDEGVEAMTKNWKLALYAKGASYEVAEKGPTPAVVKSDVDELPAFKVKPRKNAYAVVIGIENYRQKLPTADFATHDAQTITEYLVKVFGYPEENVITLLNDNASNVDLAKYFEKWLPNNVEPKGTVFVYYSGHGAPNPKTGDAYIVPYDGDPSFIDQTGYSLQRLYNALGRLPAKEIVVVLDSCFSGAGGRSVLAQGARPLVMNLKSAEPARRNMVILSATSGSQISSTYREKGHGLFTYFMLKGIKNEEVVRQDGSIAMSDLFGYLKPQVERIARKQYNNEQLPQLIEPKKN